MRQPLFASDCHVTGPRNKARPDPKHGTTGTSARLKSCSPGCPHTHSVVVPAEATSSQLLGLPKGYLHRAVNGQRARRGYQCHCHLLERKAVLPINCPRPLQRRKNELWDTQCLRAQREEFTGLFQRQHTCYHPHGLFSRFTSQLPAP